MSTVILKQAREAQGRGALAKFFDLFRAARAREADAILARYANGRISDAAEREMTEKLLHVGDSFRF